MAFKRKYIKSKKTPKRSYKKSRTSTKKNAKSSSKLVKLIKRVTLKTQETKKSVTVSSTRATCVNNGLLILNDSPLYTTQGVTDPSTNSFANRIGDEVTPVGVSIKFAVMLDPRQSVLHCRWMFIKGPATLTLTMNSLFTGIMDNKQMDMIDTEKWTIIQQKRFTIRRPNASIGTSTYTSTPIIELPTAGGAYPSGTEYTAAIGDAGWTPHFFSTWIPGKTFGSKVRYQGDNNINPKNWSYYSVLLTFANDVATDPVNAGPVTLFPGTAIGKMDQYCNIFYFKDA